MTSLFRFSATCVCVGGRRGLHPVCIHFRSYLRWYSKHYDVIWTDSGIPQHQRRKRHLLCQSTVHFGAHCTINAIPLQLTRNSLSLSLSWLGLLATLIVTMTFTIMRILADSYQSLFHYVVGGGGTDGDMRQIDIVDLGNSLRRRTNSFKDGAEITVRTAQCCWRWNNSGRSNWRWSATADDTTLAGHWWLVRVWRKQQQQQQQDIRAFRRRTVRAARNVYCDVIDPPTTNCCESVGRSRDMHSTARALGSKFVLSQVRYCLGRWKKQGRVCLVVCGPTRWPRFFFPLFLKHRYKLPPHYRWYIRNRLPVNWQQLHMACFHCACATYLQLFDVAGYLRFTDYAINIISGYDSVDSWLPSRYIMY